MIHYITTRYIDAYIDTQKALNESVIPNHQNLIKPDEYKLAMILEYVELVESGRQWKWWKKSNNIDVWNEYIEYVDMAHFLFSYLYMKYPNTGFMASNVEELLNSYKKRFPVNADQTFDRSEVNNILSDFSSNDEDPGRIYRSFEDLGQAIGIDETKFMVIFYLKLCLNKFRQLGGYALGDYVKVVGGKEDNQLLEKLYESINVGELYHRHEFRQAVNTVFESFVKEFFDSKISGKLIENGFDRYINLNSLEEL